MYEKMKVTKNTKQSTFFPFEFKSFKLTVRHGGDPLIAAMNLTPVKGSFNFGDTS